MAVYLKKSLQWSPIFILYLIFVYWSMEAVWKYIDEPTRTKVHYTLGDDGKNIKVPLMTIYEKKPSWYLVSYLNPITSSKPGLRGGVCNPSF